MTEPDQTTSEPEQPTAEPDQLTPEPEQPATEPTPVEVDLNAFLLEQEQYARDINAEFESMKVAADSPEWTQWCDELAEWNEAVAASREEEAAEETPDPA